MILLLPDSTPKKDINIVTNQELKQVDPNHETQYRKK
jgi:hypothetical protein